MSDLKNITVGGLEPLTTIDFPNKLASVVFLQGCNLACRFCYNNSLLSFGAPSLDWDEVIDFLRKREGFLEGVVFSGGEPCLHKDLAKAISEVKTLGFEIALHTNGFYPEVVKDLINRELISFVAIDLKAPPQKYESVTSKILPVEAYSDLADFIVSSGIDYEYRTTFHPSLLEHKDFLQMAEWLKKHKIGTYALQQFRHGQALDKSLKEIHSINLPPETFQRLKSSVKKLIIRSERSNERIALRDVA